MHVRKMGKGPNARRMACLGAMVLGGCGVALTPQDNNGLPSTLNLSVVDDGRASTYYETSPNDLFESAEPVDTTDEPRIIRGRVAGPDDVDVYDLGPAAPGDRIVVNMTMADSLDGAIALFDHTGTALLVNDHRNVYLGRTEPFVDVVVQRASEACFVAVSATPGFPSPGDYALAALKELAPGLPEPRPDIVLLVFDGGRNVRIGSRAPVDVPPFDAADIDPVYAGDTDLMVDEIVYHVREDYVGFDVTILSTSEGDTFEPGMTRVFFGTYDAALLGVAEGVDEFNASGGQSAVVFTDTFAAFMRLNPPPFQISQAIANVASHEIGHLLGMVHTADPTGIMDVTASLNGLLQDQAFTRSPIYAAVFPLGYQDAVQHLLDVVGGDPALVFSSGLPADRRTARLWKEAGRPPARASRRFSSCGLADHKPAQ